MHRSRFLGVRYAAGVVALYVVGYLVLMDKHRPTSPYPNASDYFESSFRWAAPGKASKDASGPNTQFPTVTIWNIVYRPLDKVYFRLFPRSASEIEHLKSIGYFR